MKNSIISTVVILICFAFNLQAQQSETIAINAEASMNQLEALSQSNSQNASTVKNQKSVSRVESQAAPFEGLAAYMDAHLHYPQAAKENSIEGKVKVLIHLSSEGKILDAQIVESLGYGCDEAVLDMILNMPNWKPAIRNGQPVETKVVMPVTFALTL